MKSIYTYVSSKSKQWKWKWTEDFFTRIAICSSFYIVGPVFQWNNDTGKELNFKHSNFIRTSLGFVWQYTIWVTNDNSCIIKYGPSPVFYFQRVAPLVLTFGKKLHTLFEHLYWPISFDEKGLVLFILSFVLFVFF